MDRKSVEEELAHLRRTTDEMSLELARQGAEIDRLTRRVALLLARAAEAEQDAGGGAVFGDERPPHY